MKRNVLGLAFTERTCLLAVSFHSVLLAVGVYLLFIAVLYKFVSFRFGGFAVSFRGLVHAFNKEVCEFVLTELSEVPRMSKKS